MAVNQTYHMMAYFDGIPELVIRRTWGEILISALLQQITKMV